MVPLALAGCGGSDSDSGRTSSPSTETRTTEAASGNPSVIMGRTLTCTGGGPAKVIYGNSHEAPLDLIVGWEGEAYGSSSVSYILIIEGGGITRQAALKRIVGTGEIVQFLYDLSTNEQTNIDPPDASQEVMKFPGTLAGVDGSWQARGVVSVDGQDTVSCA